MVLVKLFDDHILDDIRSIYQTVNALLVQHSILPKIRYGLSEEPTGVPKRGAVVDNVGRLRRENVRLKVENELNVGFAPIG